MAITVASKALTTSIRLSLDAITPWSKKTLSVSAEKLMTVEGLNGLLAEYGHSPSTIGARAISVQLVPDIKISSSNCRLFVIEIQWDSVGVERELPSRLFLKLPCNEIATKAFCNFIDVWRLECSFLKNFSHDCPVRLPITYAIAQHRSRFILLEEDLNSDPSVTLFTNADIVAGPSMAMVKSTLSTFARFHAFYQGLSQQQQDQRLPFTTHPYLSPLMSQLNQAINVRAVAPCRKKAADIFSAEHAQLFQRSMGNWQSLLDIWYRGPLTLIHGDSHLGNVFQYGSEVGMIDFQAAQWGKGIRDVQYFLINSVPETLLVNHEQEWVQYYIDELQANGVTLSLSDAWEQYRGFSFQTLMTMVVSIGLGPLTEKDAVMDVMLARAVAAIDRLDFSAWLDQNL